jgi:hypothetical protein
MPTFFVTCLILGGVTLVLQLFMGLAGGDHPGSGHEIGHGGHDDGHSHHAEGLHLFSARAIAAGVAFFGLGGLAGVATPLGVVAAVPLALVSGFAGMVMVALAMRSMLKLDSDKSLSLHRAVGVTGVVYLSIPAEKQGAGKVHLTVQERFVELQAVTPDAALPTGSPVLVIDVAGPDTVVVVPNPIP